mmetsp:Transcript_28358/g.83937  ORF Transcript_28358/g.83937 Transcript_28358/m.83937 type:complete len:235 (+) Transcript_28358:1277-1981(+)
MRSQAPTLRRRPAAEAAAMVAAAWTTTVWTCRRRRRATTRRVRSARRGGSATSCARSGGASASASAASNPGTAARTALRKSPSLRETATATSARRSRSGWQRLAAGRSCTTSGCSTRTRAWAPALAPRTRTVCTTRRCLPTALAPARCTARSRVATTRTAAALRTARFARSGLSPIRASGAPRRPQGRAARRWSLSGSRLRRLTRLGWTSSCRRSRRRRGAGKTSLRASATAAA